MATPSSIRSRRPVLALLAGVLLVPLAACSGGGPTGLAGRRAAHPGDRWVLFIGNSLTYENDLPGMLERVARLSGDDSLRAVAIAHPDYALEDHFAVGNAQESLAAYEWSAVVMQQGPSSTPQNQDHLRIWSEAFAPLIRDAGAEPMLYQVWPSFSRWALDAANVLASYTNAAAAIDGLLAPAGDAFTAALEADAEIGLFGEDGFHPSGRGTYLAAITILARLNDIDPRTLPATIPGYSAPEAVVRALQDAAAVALARNAARPTASAQSRARVLVADTTFFAEGLDADPRDGTLYVTSIRHRTVMAVKRDGTVHSALIAPPDGVAGAFGVAFDGARDALWVTTAATPHMQGYQPGDSARAELLRVRLADGMIVTRWRLGDGTGAPGELAVTPTGDVLVSDGLKGRLYRLRAGAAALETITSPLLRSPQGIAPSADGMVAWVADWSRGLMRWDLRTDSVSAVMTAEGATLRGVDGLRRWGSVLVGVQSGASPARIIAITLDDASRTIVAVRIIDQPMFAGEPTVGTIIGDRYIYVSSSGWPFWADDGSRKAGTPALPPVTVRELQLPR